MDLTAYIRDIPDFPKPGIIFKDITPLVGDRQAFAEAINRMARLVSPDVTRVVAIESRGFILGGALAAATGRGFVPIRKAGKLPWKTVSLEYALEYGTDTVEIHQDALASGERVVLVDDVLATGGTAQAACRLIEKCGARVDLVLFLLELGFLKGRGKLSGCRVISLMTV